MAFVLRLVLGPFCCCAPCCRRRKQSSGRIPDGVDDVCGDECPLFGGKPPSEAASFVRYNHWNNRAHSSVTTNEMTEYFDTVFLINVLRFFQQGQEG